MKTLLTSLGKKIYILISKAYQTKIEEIDKKVIELQSDIDDIQAEIESKLVLSE